jgi:hypothetical protein
MSYPIGYSWSSIRYGMRQIVRVGRSPMTGNIRYGVTTNYEHILDVYTEAELERVIAEETAAYRTHAGLVAQQLNPDTVGAAQRRVYRSELNIQKQNQRREREARRRERRRAR